MQTVDTTIVESTRSMTNKEMVQTIISLQARVKELEDKFSTGTVRTASEKEMTDDDARKVLSGDLASKKHKEAAQELSLTYGQIYSCRLEYTFKHIHKELKETGFTNPWVKK